MVGERGPELFVPDLSGRILPSAVTAGAMGAGGGGNNVTVHQVINIQADVVNTMDARIANAAPLLIEASKQAMFEALRRR